jgi:uncharacterized protein (DUF2147 family)
MTVKLALAALACSVLSVSVAFADESQLLGRWRTPQREGIVEIYRCEAAVCGRVVDSAGLRANPELLDERNRNRSRRVMGLVVLQNFTGGPERWTGGPLYDPATGDSAPSGSLRLRSRDTLEVRGCIAAFLCRTQTWRKV